MKRTMLVLALMLVSTGAALAQLDSTTKVTAQVPFGFVLGDKAVPAGELTVQSLARSGVLLIQNADANISLVSMPQMNETKKPAGSCALVFHRYNNRYFLSGIKIEGSRITYRLPESKTEAELRAQNTTATDEIRLASLK